MINNNLNINPQEIRNSPVCSGNMELDLLPAQSLESKITNAINLLNNDYYSFGKLLQENYLISKKTVKCLINITGLISSDDLKSELDHLSQTIDNLRNIFNKLEKASSAKEESLQILNHNILTVISSLEDYNKIVKHLRALGISTKIENARLKVEGIGFSTIAENVEQLAEVINEKALQIRHNSKSLGSDVQKLLAKLNILSNEQKNESAVVIGKALKSLSTYQSSYDSSFNSAKLIHEVSSQISSDINNLITFVQKQDIIRQQLEHVKENVSRISRNPLKNKLRLDEDIASIKELAVVCQLELAQLLHSKTEIEDTAESIEEHNCNIRHNANNIVEQSGSFILSGNAASSIQEVEENLSVISESLKKSYQTNESLTGSINSLADAIANLNKFVSEIEEIGAEIEMIALNARIKAAHIGDEGAALGVLSEAIQKLSLEAKELSLLVSAGLMKVLNKTEELSSSNRKEQQAILEEFRKVDESLKASLIKIQDSNSSLDAMKTELNISVMAMKHKLDEMKTGLSYKFDVLKEITFVQTILEEYAGFAKAAGLDITEEDKEFLRNYSSSYTMDSERKIHTSLVSDMQKDPLESEDDLLGDNIELF